MASDALYPPAPANAPADITRLDAAYRGRVVAMIGGLFFFLLLYLLFIALAGAVAYGLLVMPLPSMSGRGMLVVVVFKFGGALAALLLCLFLVKGLFKGRRVERSSYVALRADEHPELFAFVNRVYHDVGAPPPRRVYVSPDVNAALVYNTSLLNLIIPPRKDLLIGLGLVNVLNLAEFKAVLAHEFGHFAQRSVGLGSYLYVANQVMADVIYGRDALDRFVDGWSQQDIRISFPAWGLKGVLWLVRKILSGTYEGLNVLHLSLSRQLEFNADNVAVRLTGSDALIHGLARTDFANQCLQDSARSLDGAADRGLYSDDLFYHQAQSAARLRRLLKDDKAGLPPELPANEAEQREVFPPVDDGIPERYRSHPTNHMREKNAKRIYIRSPQDERSPWLLFGAPARLRREVTERFYLHHLGRSAVQPQRPALEVQQFIEHAESTYDPKYHGFYDNRFIEPGDLSALPARAWSHNHIAAWLASWPPANLEARMQAYQRRQEELDLLHGLRNGALTLKGNTFTFRDRQHSAADAETLLTQVDREISADLEGFHGHDREVFVAHGSMALELDQSQPHPDAPRARMTELLERYRFHVTLQSMLRVLMEQQGQLQSLFNFLSTQPQLCTEDFGELRRQLQTMNQVVEARLQEARALPTPALTNLAGGTPLHTLLLEPNDRPLPPLPANNISGDWLSQLATRLERVLTRIKRLHFKSLGGLLAYQETLAADWQRQTAPVSPASMSNAPLA